MNRWLQSIYQPTLKRLLQWPKLTVLSFALLLLSSWWPLSHMGSEFMPELDEGDLMYMPTTDPGISIGKARELLQQTDKMIATIPEVELVMGKMGRAETATDPAPLTMMESYIKLKPKDQWRDGINTRDLIDEMNEMIDIPGIANAWVMPIKTRIDMLATGIKTPVGIKVSGPDLNELQTIGVKLETLLSTLPGTASVYSEKVAGGRYIKIDINRLQAASFGLNINTIQEVIAYAIGGRTVTHTIEDNERYPINLRFPQGYRDSPEQLQQLPIVTAQGAHITLGQVADIYIEAGPPAIKSENGRVNAWTYIDIQDIDVGSYVQAAQRLVHEQLKLKPGYAIKWAGQYEYMLRAKEKLNVVIPVTLGIIVILLFMSFRSWPEVGIIMGTLPLALVGSLWLLYLQSYNWSIAVGVGMIALAGVAAETSVIMLVYLRQARAKAKGRLTSHELKVTILNGACGRIRPVLMTAAATILGLLPVLLGEGDGAEVMSRLAAPMVGGMISVILMTLLLLPVVYYLWQTNTTTPGNDEPV